MDNVNMDNLKTVAQAYGELAIKKKQIEAEMKRLEAPLREALADRGNVSVGNYVYTVKTMSGRKTLDKEALSSALSNVGLDLAAFEKQGKPYTTMSVKEVNVV